MHTRVTSQRFSLTDDMDVQNMQYTALGVQYILCMMRHGQSRGSQKRQKEQK